MKKYIQYESKINWNEYKDSFFNEIWGLMLIITLIEVIMYLFITQKTLNFLEVLGLLVMNHVVLFIILYIIDFIFRKPYIETR